MGPTAVGKSQLAIALARILPLNIISVDSAMVYRGMDIGTAKPTPEMLSQIPHQLINLRDPVDSYSAGDFVQDAYQAIHNSLRQARIPLLVGGTMLYFHVLQQGLSVLPASCAELRKQFKQQLQQTPLTTLYDQLVQQDPVTAKRIHPHDAQRIQRALAVYTLSGQSLTALQQIPRQPFPYPFINLAIVPENRDQLKETIAQRFQQMLQVGFVHEVEQLYQRSDLNPDLPACRAVGYRQMWTYLAGEVDYETMKMRSIIATRQLAKRQLTWLRRWPNLQCFTAEDSHLLAKIKHKLMPILDSP